MLGLMSMKPLLILWDSDIFPDTPRVGDFLEFPTRVAVKVAIFDEEKEIALVGTKYRLLPGGGADEGESLLNAVARESLEEVGCTLTEIKEIAFTEEFRVRIKRHQITHFFTAKLAGEKGVPKTTQKDEQGIQVEWFSLNDAVALLEKQLEEIPFESYHSCFNIRTHLAFLKSAKRLK